MLPEPAVAVKVPPLQLPVAPFGVATTRLVGRVSVKATPVSATVLPPGLVMVKVSVETALGVMTVGLNALVIDGGATTAMLAEAVPPVSGRNVPVPSSNVAVTWLVVLFLVPAVVPVTLSETVHELEPGSVKEVMTMLPVPESATTSAPNAPARQVPPRPLGLATTRPPGRLSLTEVFTSVVDAFGLVKVKVSDVLPFNGTLAAPKALTKVGATGGGVTVKVAVLLVAPGPLSLAEIGPVVLLNTPVLLGVTFTEIKHDPCAADVAAGREFRALPARSVPAGSSDPPTRVIVPEPGTAVIVPPQSLLRPLGDATARPAGKLSVNEMPLSDTSLLGGVELLFGLLMVKLANDVPFWTVVSGTKTLLIVGGRATVKVADAEPPVPPLVALTGPVEFR